MAQDYRNVKCGMPYVVGYSALEAWEEKKPSEDPIRNDR